MQSALAVFAHDEEEALTERPILMSPPMVRAILEGRKTQTRRVMKPQPMRPEVAPHCENGWWMWRVWTPENAERGFPSVRTGDRRCPYGVPGDRLWVRETWQLGTSPFAPLRYIYRADGTESHHGWKPSIFMPRAAGRLVLELTAVRVERLQEIDEADAEAEGCERRGANDQHGDERNYVEGYQDLWDSLNAKRGFGWDVNPWVWVLQFMRTA